MFRFALVDLRSKYAVAWRWRGKRYARAFSRAGVLELGATIAVAVLLVLARAHGYG